MRNCKNSGLARASPRLYLGSRGSYRNYTNFGLVGASLGLTPGSQGSYRNYTNFGLADKLPMNDKEVCLGICRYIIEHIQLLDRILEHIEQAGYTIARLKSQFYINGIKIVGYVYKVEGRSLDSAKIIKILK